MCFELIKSNLRRLQNKLSLLELLTPPLPPTFPPFTNTFFTKETFFSSLFLSSPHPPPAHILTRLELCCTLQRTDPLHPGRITRWLFRALYIEIYSFPQAALRLRRGMQFGSGCSCSQLQGCLKGQKGHTGRLLAAPKDTMHRKVWVRPSWFCTGSISHLPALETLRVRPGE